MAKERTAEETLALLDTLEANLGKAGTRNAGLLEVLESVEGQAAAGADESEQSAASVLRGLRARLSAAHGPNAALRRDLAEVGQALRAQFSESEQARQRYTLLEQEVAGGSRELELERRRLEEEQRQVQELQRKWQGRLDESKRHVQQQQEKLAALSERLAGQTTDLVAQRSLAALTHSSLDKEREVSVRVNLQSASEAALLAEAEQLRQQLRALMVRNVDAENERLRLQLAQRHKEDQLDFLGQTNQKLKSEATRSRQEVLKATRQFEKRTAEANKRLIEMATELSKAQEMARRFQDLLALERRKQTGLRHALEDELQKSSRQRTVGLTEEQGKAMAEAQQTYVQTLTETLSHQTRSSASGHIRVDDVVRKNENLLLEVARLKADVKRLKAENAAHLRQTKAANADAMHMRMYVTTSMADRTELQKRLERADRDHHRLESSLTHQASDWIRSKRQGKSADTAKKWEHLSHVPEVDFFKYSRSHMQSP